MSTDNINWIQAFSASIRRGEFPANLSVEQFNEVLKWLIGREFEVGVRLTQEFSSFFSAPSVARDNTLYALDDMLFGGVADSPFAHMGLPRNTDIGIVKSRYKRLMQVYHPDRGLATELGLASRAEALNSAFSNIKEVQSNLSTGSSKLNATRDRYPSEPVHRPSPATRLSPGFSHHPNKARVFMGSAQQVKRKILIGLAGLSCLFLLVTYINNRPLDSENTLIASSFEEEVQAHKVAKDSDDLEVLPSENMLENVNAVSRIAIDKKQSTLPTELETAIAKYSRDYQQSYDESVSETTKTKEKLATVRKQVGEVQYFKLEKFENINDLTVSVRSVASNDEVTEVLDKSKLEYTTDSFNLALATKEAGVNPKEVGVEKRNVEASDTDNATKIKAALAKFNATSAVPSQVLDKDTALGILKKYIDGMYINDIDKILLQVNGTITMDNKLVSKAALRKTYSSWLDDSINRKYNFTVKETISSGNIFTVKGRASIRFAYKNKAKKRFNGPLTFDFKLINNKPLIVAIRGK